MSVTQAHNPEAYTSGQGNILGGLSNPYLESSSGLADRPNWSAIGLESVL